MSSQAPSNDQQLSKRDPVFYLERDDRAFRGFRIRSLPLAIAIDWKGGKKRTKKVIFIAMAAPLSDRVLGFGTCDNAKLEDALTAHRNAATPEAKLAALKSYDEAFTSRNAKIAAGMDGLVTEIKECMSAADKKEAEAKLAEDEVAQLQAELDALKKEFGDAPVKTVPGTPYADFMQSRADLAAQLHVMQATVMSALNGRRLKMKNNDEAQKLSSSWSTTRSKLNEDITKMTEKTEGLTKESPYVAKDVSTQVLKAGLQKLDEHVPSLQSRLSEEASKQQAYDESLKSFESERRRLLVWSRQQKTNLDAMVEPDHVQEFCASLLNNFPAMEENFTVLLEVAESLLPNVNVENALLEVNEVWLNLQVTACDRLRHTLLEIHPRSKLEDEVRAFSNFSQRAKEFLKEFATLLSTPTDAKSEQLVKPLLEQCKTLEADFVPYAELSQHLQEFALRMECLRDNNTNLQRAVLGRLTFLSHPSTTCVTTSSRRKEEYLERIKDLKRWIDVKSQGETWADIHARIVKIQTIVDEERKNLQQQQEKEAAAQKDGAVPPAETKK